METINKVLTSHIISDSSDDDDDEDYNKISTAELCVKIKTFRNLCLGNKINISNAFDIDMIGSFYSWLEKNKPLINVDENDVTSFQEISDYLDASSKVYSYRVDNLTETTGNLVEKFKIIQNNNSITKSDDEVELKTQKPKGTKLMLTTSDKLRSRPIEDESESTLDPSLINKTNFSFKELFKTGRPHRHFTLMYYDSSLAEENKISYDEKNENDESFYLMEGIKDIENGLDEQVICPDFNNFVASRDEVNNTINSQLEGIEYHFDPDYHSFQNDFDDLNCNQPDNTELDTNTNTKDKDKTVVDGLLECIDNVNRDYSFFNPQLLAQWNGPKAWKAKAMVKALKLYNPKEQKVIISNPDDNIDDILQENVKQTKNSKNRNIVKNDNFNIDWLSRSKIENLIIKNIQSKEKILPRTLLKWNALDNISDIKSIVVNIKNKLTLLKYTEVIPDWWKCHENQIKKKRAKHSNSHQNINDCDKTIIETHDKAPQINYEDTDKLINENDGATDDKEKEIDDEDNNEKLCNLDEPGELNPEDDNDNDDDDDDDDDDDIESRTELKMNIGELKKEISDIIDEECVETDPKSQWSSKLSFQNLLTKLRIYERDELSIPIIFVGLLHLANERGLKLFNENCTINDIEDETFIIKPMNKK